MPTALPCSSELGNARVGSYDQLLRVHHLMILTVSIAALTAACSFDWDPLDPRLAAGGGATTRAAGGSGQGGDGAGGFGGRTHAGGDLGGAGGNGGSANTGGMGSGARGGSSSTGGASSVVFFDDFNRADDPDIGNGWVEKTPDAFALINDEVLKGNSSAIYRDHFVYRPLGENLLDVEVAAEIVINALPPQFPQVCVRATKVTVPDELDAYCLYLSGSNSANLVRQKDDTFGNTLESPSLSTPLVVGERYRLTLEATGTNPVMLNALVEHDTSSGWVTLASMTHADGDASAFTTPGAVGFLGSLAGQHFAVDNFRRTPR